MANVRPRHVVRFVLLICGLTLLGAGCSSDGGSNPLDAGLDSHQSDGPPTEGRVDTTPTPDTTPAPGPFTVTVYDGDPFTGGVTRDPFAGATVAFDLPGGQRVEVTTAADGKATVAEVDWAQGTVSVTGHHPGRRPISMVGVRRQDGDQELWLFALEPAWVQVSGTAQNVDPAFDWTIVSPTVPGLNAELYKPRQNYNLSVAPGKPFSLVGVHCLQAAQPASPREMNNQILGWAKADSPGLTSPAAVNLDFATPPTEQPVKFTGTIVLPSNPQSPVRTASAAFANSTTLSSGFAAYLGLANVTTLSGDGNEFAIEGEYLPLAGATGPATTYGVWIGPSEISLVTLEGWPKDGERITTLLDQPAVIKPAPGLAASLFEELEWTTPDPSIHSIVELRRGELRVWSVWYVWVMPGTTKVTVPRLPSSADAAELLGTKPMDAQVSACDRDTVRMVCKRLSRSKVFRLQPPLP